MIYSFDIFDTCFVRACGFPHNIFDLLAYRILGETSSESMRMDFANIRVQGEKMARKSLKEEVTLDEIYACCDFRGITDLSSEEIALEEQQVEKEQLVVVKSVFDQIEKIRNRGFSIIYISDMYLPEKFLLCLLQENGLWKEGDKLYVSSTYCKTKRTGNLYELVANENHISFKEWSHYGDNIYSDYKVPKKKGINAHIITHEFSYYEKRILEHNSFPAFFVHQHIAGISKSVRLHLEKNIRVDFAANLIAPLYTSFVYNLLKDAQERGLTQLFFLSRDGYILYYIALQLQYMFPDITIKYIYVSRVSLYFPGMDVLDLDGYVNMLGTLEGKNNIELLKKWTGVDVSSDVGNDFINEVNLTHEAGIENLKQILSNTRVAVSLLQKHREQSDLVEKYFIQVGLSDISKKSAIIDVRGTRNCHQAINNILNRIGGVSVYGYYIEVLKNRKTIREAGSFTSFLYMERYVYDKRMQFIPYIGNVMEQYFSVTDQNRTVGYYLDNNGLVNPKLADDIVDTETVELFTLHKKIISIYMYYYLTNKLYLHNTFLSMSILDNLADFATFPKHEYLKALEGVRVSDSATVRYPLIQKIGIKGLYYMLTKKLQIDWKIGSIVYSFPFLEKSSILRLCLIKFATIINRSRV